MTRGSAWVACGIFLVVLGGWGQARAQTAAPDAVDAQKSFNEARDLIQQGKWEEACPKLAASQRADPRGTTLYRLAECYEHTEKPASAWALSRAAAKAAADAGDAKRAEFASSRASRLAPTLSQLLLTVREPPAGLVVQRDGVVVPESEWNAKVPSDPGEHVITAKAPRKIAQSVKVEVPANGATVVLVLPTLVDDANIVTPSALKANAPEPMATVPEKPRPTSSGHRTLGLGLVVAGVAGATLGTVLYATSDRDSGEAPCNGTCKGGAVVLVSGAVVFVLGMAIFLASIGDDPAEAKAAALSRRVEIRF